jgi:glycosyltransferase involved in cell wall biosynthesis
VKQIVTNVSVVIPCYNARPWLGATLASVYQQALPAVEVIVVDDGSTDGSGDLVSQDFPDVRLVRTEQRGPSHARNVGTSIAQAPYIQYLDADDLLGPGKLGSQMDMLERTGADVAYGDWCELRVSEDGRFDFGKRFAHTIQGDPAIALFTDFWSPPAAYLFRRSIIDAIGGWNEQLPIIQDARFALDCALHGGRFVYWPGLAAYYRVHTSGSVSTRDQVAFTRDCLRNAIGVEDWWRQHGDLTPLQCSALVQVYAHIARTSFVPDPVTFESAYSALERLRPGYTPDRPWHLALASRAVGYRRAEALATRYRAAKRLVRKLRRSAAEA